MPDPYDPSLVDMPPEHTVQDTDPVAPDWNKLRAAIVDLQQGLQRVSLQTNEQIQQAVAATLLPELVQDIVADMLIDQNGARLAYNDAAGRLTVPIVLGGTEPEPDPDPDPGDGGSDGGTGGPVVLPTAVPYTNTSVITYDAGWTLGEIDRYATAAGATLSFAFTGTRFGVMGTVDAHHGTATVSVDGVQVGTINETNLTRADNQRVFTSAMLTNTRHVVTIRVSTPTVSVAGVAVDGTPEVKAPDTTPQVLWAGDLTRSTLTSALGLNNVDSNSENLPRGSLVASTSDPDGVGRVFRSVLGTATRGYRGYNELRLVASSSFPRDEVILEYHMRITTMGSLQSNNDAKLGYGLVGAPTNASADQISYGLTKFDNSWSARTTLTRAGYVSGALPFGFSCYLYAEQAGGRNFSGSGIRFPYRNAAGTYLTPVQGRWYKHRVRVKVNTPGVANGVYQVWVDDVQYLSLTNVMWNPSGNNIPITKLMSQSFTNDTLSTSATFDQTAPRLLLP